MKIESVEMESFGKFSHFSLSFENGINIIKGGNEAGKSTLLAFIRCMLYGFGDNRGDLSVCDRKKYLPWGKDVLEGAMTISAGGKSYRIYRRSGKTQRQDVLEVTNAATGEPENLDPSSLVGIERSGFLKTLCVSQAQTEISGSDSQITSKLMNLAQSGDEDASYEAAMKRLDDAGRVLLYKTGKGGKLYDAKNRLYELTAQKQEVARRQAEIGEKEKELAALNQSLEQQKAALQEESQQEDESEKLLLYQKLAAAKEACGAAKAQYDEAKAQFDQFEGESVPKIEDKPRHSLLWPGIFGVLFILSFIMCFQNKWFLLPSGVFLLLFFLPEVKFRRERKMWNAKCDVYQTRLLEARCLVDEKFDVLTQQQAAVSEIEKELLEKFNPDAAPAKAASAAAKQAFIAQSQRAADLSAWLGAQKAGLRSLDELSSEMEALKENIDRYQHTYDAIEAAKSALQAAFWQMQKDFAPLLNKKCGEILAPITGGRSMLVSAELVPTLDHKNLAYFSEGMKDQVYLALRLALADLILNSDAPLFLDDPFVTYDEGRRNAVFTFLAQQKRQVIYLTCHSVPEMLSGCHVAELS